MYIIEIKSEASILKKKVGLQPLYDALNVIFFLTFETVYFEGSNLRERAKSIGFFKGAPQNSNEQDSRIIIRKFMSKFII